MTPSAPPPRASVPKLTFPPPKTSPRRSSSLAPVVIAGSLAALAGAGMWTAVVLISGGWEIGWFAWGVGALVGFVMSRMSPLRSTQLGILAAVLAALGLAVGKVATFRAAVPKIAREILLADHDALARAFALDMRDAERYSPEVSVQLASLSGGDTMPDALAERMMEEAQARMESAPPAERERVARAFSNRILAEIGISTQFGATLSAFDFLWFFLAIATAFKMMRG